MTMKFVQRLKSKTKDNEGQRTPIIAFLGDSVTQGCFEIWKENGEIRTVFDSGEAYSEKVKKLLAMFYPEAPVAIVNFGVNGDYAPNGARRFAKDVLSANPDLLVVCYGLNDCDNEMKGLESYKEGLRSIFTQAKKAGIETIFMTPNMMNTYTDKRRLEEAFHSLGDLVATRQLEGVFDTYMDAAREVCNEEGIRLCDCYAIWKHMYEAGVDVTALLSNCINHPTREMHGLFAWELVRTILEKYRGNQNEAQWLTSQLESLIPDFRSAYDQSDARFSALKQLSTVSEKLVGSNDSSYQWTSVGLVLGNKTKIRAKFTAANLEGLQVIATIDGERQSLDIVETTEEGVYMVDFYGLRAYEYGKEVTFQFYQEGTEIGAKLCYSVNTYIREMYMLAEVKELLLALHNYGRAASVYISLK